MGIPRCRHCRRSPGVWRRRGLCALCYRDPVIRQRYPELGTDQDALFRGLDFVGPAGPCPGPMPGTGRSPERLVALARRYVQRVDFWPDRWDAATVRRVAALLGLAAG